jgi:hypothetical protein
MTTEHYRITDSRLLTNDDRTLQNYCFDNTLHLRSGGAWIEFRPGYRLSWAISRFTSVPQDRFRKSAFD